MSAEDEPQHVSQLSLSHRTSACYTRLVLACYTCAVLTCYTRAVLACYTRLVLACYTSAVLACYTSAVLACYTSAVLTCYTGAVLTCYTNAVLACYTSAVQPIQLIKQLINYNSNLYAGRHLEFIVENKCIQCQYTIQITIVIPFKKIKYIAWLPTSWTFFFLNTACI